MLLLPLCHCVSVKHMQAPLVTSWPLCAQLEPFGCSLPRGRLCHSKLLYCIGGLQSQMWSGNKSNLLSCCHCIFVNTCKPANVHTFKYKKTTRLTINVWKQKTQLSFSHCPRHVKMTQSFERCVKEPCAPQIEWHLWYNFSARVLCAEKKLPLKGKWQLFPRWRAA